jgi:hypothetical protein
MLLRSFLIKVSLITGFIFLSLITSGIALAAIAPFRPGNILFHIQYFSEQQVLFVNNDPVYRTDFTLDLLEQRINDLIANTGTKHELETLEDLNKAVDQATTAISHVRQEQGDNIRKRLLELTQQADEKLKSLTIVPTKKQAVFLTFQSKIQTLLLTLSKSGVTNSELSRVTGIIIGNQGKLGDTVAVEMIAGGLIPFPPGSPGAVHAFYQLIGQHAILLCDVCHNAGKYLGIPNTCTLCHIQKRPNPHFDADCTSCHTAISWENLHIDHEGDGATDCQSCHEDKVPADYFSGQCSTCHGT